MVAARYGGTAATLEVTMGNRVPSAAACQASVAGVQRGWVGRQRI